MAEPSPIVELDGVSFGYGKDLLLRNLSLRIHSQERVALIGSNGSGKTTIVRLLLGLDVPRTGEIRLLGKKVTWGSHFPDVGYIGDPSHSDDGLGLPLWLTVEGIVSAHRSVLGKGLSTEFAEELYDRLNLAVLEKREIRFLAAGERRRLMAYLALSKGPKLLIADEATEIVSAKERPDILNCVRACCETFGTGLFWVSHDSDSTAQITDFVYQLGDGEIKMLPERMFQLTIERDEREAESEQIGERLAPYRMRELIEGQTFSRLRLTIEQRADED